MNIEDRYSISLKVINTFLDTKKEFTLQEVLDEIKDQGGIYRVCFGVGIRDYLYYLCNLDFLDYDCQHSKFVVLKQQQQ